MSIDNALYAVGGTMEKSHYTPMPLIECYNLHKNTWEEIHVPISSELERDNAAVIGLRDRIVVSGGFVFTSCSVSASVVELNPASGQWRELASLHTARESHATVVNDVTMYVIGGRNLSGCLSSVERYDKDTGMFCFSATWLLFIRCYKNVSGTTLISLLAHAPIL